MSVLQTVQKNNRQFTYGQTVQKKNNKQFTYGQTVQKKQQTIYIWTDSCIPVFQKHWLNSKWHTIVTISVKYGSYATLYPAISLFSKTSYFCSVGPSNVIIFTETPHLLLTCTGRKASKGFKSKRLRLKEVNKDHFVHKPTTITLQMKHRYW